MAVTGISTLTSPIRLDIGFESAVSRPADILPALTYLGF
jgi:hypothetical protein